MRVSFDFDGCLDKPSVQKYAKELVDRGVEVWICTARFENVEDYTEEFCEKYGIKDIKEEHQNLFDIAVLCGISFDHIKFTNMEPKDSFFVDSDFVWHLDDDQFELRVISRYTKVKAISVIGNTWKNKCEKLLK